MIDVNEKFPSLYGPMSYAEHSEMMRTSSEPQLDPFTHTLVYVRAWKYGSPNGFSAVEQFYRELHDLAVIMITQGDFDDGDGEDVRGLGSRRSI